MSERENNSSRDEQQNPGYGQDANNITNADRDRQPTNAGNQQQNEHPQMGTQREGQQNDQSRTEDPTRRGENPQQPGKTPPEVPQREEEHERQTPKAGQTDQNSNRENDLNTPQL